MHLGVEADVEALKACDEADADCVLATWKHAVCHIIKIICTASAANRSGADFAHTQYET
jgi:hypothetical protein